MSSRSAWRALGTCAALGVLVAGLVNLFLPRMYESTATALIVPAVQPVDSYQTSLMIQSRISNYPVVGRSPLVLQSVLDDLGNDISPDELLAKTAVRVVPDTAALSVEARDRDPGQAQRLAASFASSFATALVQLEQADAKSALIAIQWVSPANFPSQPVSPNELANLAIGLAIGLLVGATTLIAPLLRTVILREGQVHVVVVGPWAERPQLRHKEDAIASSPPMAPSPARNGEARQSLAVGSQRRIAERPSAGSEGEGNQHG